MEEEALAGLMGSEGSVHGQGPIAVGLRWSRMSQGKGVGGKLLTWAARKQRERGRRGQDMLWPSKAHLQ